MAVAGSTKKYFVMKVYDPNGVYKEVFHEKEFADKLNFSISVNGTLSAMSLTTVLGYDEWAKTDGRLASIDIGDKCKFFIYDKENQDGKQVYSGFFSGIDFEISEQKEVVKMNFLPNATYLGKKILRAIDDETTSVSFNSVDPADIMRYIIYHSGTDIKYTNLSVRDVGVSRSYDFIAQSNLEGIKKVLDLCPYGWFFFIGGDDIAYLKNFQQGEPTYTEWGSMTWGTDYWEYDPATDAVITHNINYETQVRALSSNKNLDEMVNRVLFLGGGTPQLYEQYESTASQTAYGIFEELHSDERVTETGTAEAYAERILDNKDMPKTSYTCELIDSNYSEKGYDIEELKVGDRVKINTNRNDVGYNLWGSFTWGSEYWKLSSRAIFGVEQFIKRIDYKQDSVVLELSLAPDPIVQRIEDINRDLTNYRFKDAPDIPDNI